jgi:SAM-dependent methyltransferase
VYSPKEYWAGLAQGFDSADASGFAPILHPQAPAWFNQAIDELQFRALRRALAVAQIPPGARFLDVGCGTGRWLRRYHALGFSPVGVDATLGMLRIARAHHTAVPLIAGAAFRLPFADASFDALSDITVVQHIPYETQSKALQEMVRVLRPGGRMMLLELVRGQGFHVFSRPPQDWIREVVTHGATLLGSFGEEFLFPDRLFVHLAQTVSGRKRHPVNPEQSMSAPPTANLSLARRIYWNIRRMTMSLSAWTDPLAAAICPVSAATHGVFIFRKNP